MRIMFRAAAIAVVVTVALGDPARASEALDLTPYLQGAVNKANQAIAAFYVAQQTPAPPDAMLTAMEPVGPVLRSRPAQRAVALSVLLAILPLPMPMLAFGVGCCL